jgi:hypothetical protein
MNDYIVTDDFIQTLECSVFYSQCSIYEQNVLQLIGLYSEMPGSCSVLMMSM